MTIRMLLLLLPASALFCHLLPSPVAAKDISLVSGMQCPEPNALFKHEDPTNCKEYYRCNHSVPQLQKCSGNLYFNELTGNCDWASTGFRTGCIDQQSGKTESSVTGDKTESSVTVGKTESSVTGGKTESSVTGGKTESSVTGGKTESSVTGGKTESSVTGGKTESSVTGAKTESSVTGGKTESSVTGGKPDAVAPANLQCQENSTKRNLKDIFGYLSCSQGEWIQKKCASGLKWINNLNKCSWPRSTTPATLRQTVTVPQPAAATTKDPSESCQGKVCPANAACTEGRGQQPASCNCIGGFRKNGDQCIESCQGKTCPANSACIEGRGQQATTCNCKTGFRKHGDQCIESCLGKICSANAACIEGRGQQPALCNCKTGFRKHGDQCIESCQGKNCLANAACTEGRGQQPASCDCITGFRKHGDQCIKSCQGKVCPANAACTEGRGQQPASCNCRSGFRKHGDQCIECSIDSHCGDNERCQSGSCVDPCKSLQCEQGASCQVSQRKGQCVCPTNTQGDPHVRCNSISECTDNSQCDESKRCHSGSCVNPCNLIQCGVRAKCFMLGSNPQCVCPDNTKGNPFIECEPKQGCRTYPADVQGTCVPVKDCPLLSIIFEEAKGAGRNDSVIQTLRKSICSTNPIKVCCETVATDPLGPSRDYPSKSGSSHCQFPFIYKNVSYSECTAKDDPDGKPWCSTGKDNQNNHIKDSWKHCTSNDNPITRIREQSAGSSSCQFPFIYESVSYSVCTSVDDPDGKLWCSTKKDNRNNHLKDEWKHCISDDTTVTRSGTVQDTLFPDDDIVISEEVTSDNTVAQNTGTNSTTNMNFPNKGTRQPGCLDLPDPGECRGAFPRFYYNQDRDQCDCFLFGGCDEEGVQFSWLTFEECRDTCVPGIDTKGPGCKSLSLEEIQRF